MNHVNQAIQSGWADSTIRCYSGAIKHFNRFCDSEGIPENLCFPADEFVLCAFAASSIGKHTRSTPSNRLSALKAWHIAHNMEWKGSSRLQYVLNSVHMHAPGEDCTLPHTICRIPSDSTRVCWNPQDLSPRLFQCHTSQIGKSSPV